MSVEYELPLYKQPLDKEEYIIDPIPIGYTISVYPTTKPKLQRHFCFKPDDDGSWFCRFCSMRFIATPKQHNLLNQTMVDHLKNVHGVTE
jgi:hypothetical protein